MYGGGHYIASASESLTKQGKAIKEAVIFNGASDGTLPFPVCKKGFIPIISDSKGEQRQYACYLHHDMRRLRNLNSNEKRLLEELWKQPDKQAGSK